MYKKQHKHTTNTKKNDSWVPRESFEKFTLCSRSFAAVGAMIFGGMVFENHCHTCPVSST